MKARKLDGSRWFAPTAAELMDRWLDEPQLLNWLERTRELPHVGDCRQDDIDELLRQELAAQLFEPGELILMQSPRFQAAVLEGLPEYLREILRSGLPKAPN